MTVTVCIYADRSVKITVSDRGCGIADVKKAMEPLYTTGGEDRSGLGFSVMESFMDSLHIESKSGFGTTITMTKKL